jgi:hypothetical protein
MVFFCALLLVHLFLVTRNWSAGALRGQEFRQTQTAISAYYIQAESNFSLAYPTPVLGKPWSVPMEFPLYQWCVVGVSNSLGLPLPQAGRTVSLICFYLLLPAMFILLIKLGVPARARWWCLALLVSCPLYIFYTRAFLIESMALMLSVWFLAAFVAALPTGHRGWLAAAAGAGALAALVKVTTLMIWLVPAIAFGLFQLYDSFAQGGWPAFRRILFRGVALAAGPCLGAVWWVGKADAIKALNPDGHFLMSGPMRSFNFSTWAQRFQWDIWSSILHNWHTAVMPLAMMGGVAAWVLVGRFPARHFCLVACATFILAGFTFPQLFAWHDYYSYAIGALWLCATGLALAALAARVPRLGIGLMLVVLAGQYYSYGKNYYVLQTTLGNGGTGLTDALRALTPRQGVLIMAGNDWSSVTPYYAQRKALMIRTGLEYDPAYLDAAFARLAGEEIAAFVVSGSQRQNKELIARTAAAFELDPEPAFARDDTDIYLPRSRRNWTITRLRDAPVFEGVVPSALSSSEPASLVMDPKVRTVNPHTDRSLFGHMSPMPVRYHFSFDPSTGVVEDQPIVGAHPDSELWFAVPRRMKRITCHFGLLPGAYERTGAATDGVEFTIMEKKPSGAESVLFRRWLQPSIKPEDRGMQQVELPCQPDPNAELIFLTRPGGNYAFDWAYWGKITLE